MSSTSKLSSPKRPNPHSKPLFAGPYKHPIPQRPVAGIVWPTVRAGKIVNPSTKTRGAFGRRGF